MQIKKQCPYCGRKFRPNPRLWDSELKCNRQKSCSRKRCLKKRHDESHGIWLGKEKNKTAYCRRYGNTKRWRVKNPGYQGKWRAENPEKVAKDNRQRKERRRRKERENAEIQDAMLRRKIEGIRGRHGAEIQDTIRLQIVDILDVLQGCPWRERAEIQDSMADPRTIVATSPA